MAQIIIGHTTSITSKVWAKVDHPGKWWLAVANQPFKNVFASIGSDEVDIFLERKGFQFTFLSALEFGELAGQVNTFDVQPLQPNTRYYYALVASASVNELAGVERAVIGNVVNDFFRSAQLSPEVFSFGFYSCNDFVKTGENLWPEMFHELRMRNAEFVIGGGDQAYADSSKDKTNIWKWLKKNKKILKDDYTDANGILDINGVVKEFVVKYRNCYAESWEDPALQQVYRSFPQYMIWDDHEIMDGWGSMTADQRGRKLMQLLVNDDLELNKQLTECMFLAAAQVYNEFQHSHNPGRKNDPAQIGMCEWDYEFDRGECGFYVLDMRGHHNIESKSGQRILGAFQKTRFERWLSKPETASRKVLFIVSPVPVVHWRDGFASTFDFSIGTKPMGQDDFRDEWGHLSNEQERNWLLDLVLGASQQRKQKIVFLSGDVHSYSLFRIENQDRFPDAKVYNLTSSGISRKPAPFFMSKEICGKKDKIRGYEGGEAIKYAGATGKNNFSMIHVSTDGDEVSVEIEICYFKKLTDQQKSVKTRLD